MSKPQDDPLGIRHIFTALRDVGLELRDDNPEIQALVAKQRVKLPAKDNVADPVVVELEGICK